MKKIIKITLIVLFLLFLLDNIWMMVQTKQGLDLPIWLQIVFLLVYIISAITTYKGKWFGFFASFLMGIGIMLVSIIVSL